MAFATSNYLTIGYQRLANLEALFNVQPRFKAVTKENLQKIPLVFLDFFMLQIY